MRLLWNSKKGGTVMYRRLVFLFWGLFLAVFMLGCVTGLDSYKPKSTAESKIIKCLMDYQEAFNREDLAGCLSHFHENAQLQTSSSGTMGSKKDFSDSLEFSWGYEQRIQFSSPDITINGDQAVVKIRSEWTISVDGPKGHPGHSENEYSMVRVGDRWLIMKYTFSAVY
jgi:ketosteroid isomerase-like protein